MQLDDRLELSSMQGSYDSSELELISRFRDEIGSAISADLNDDGCIRFIRARKLDIIAAAVMAREWHTWWHAPFAENKCHLTPATILTEVDDPDEPIYTRLCPHALHSFDKEGNPVYWEKTGVISGILGELKQELTMNTLLTRHVRLQELNEVRREFQGQRSGKFIDKTTIVFDLQGVSMAPDFFGIEYVRKMFEIDQKYYPERLSHMVFINAPWFFSALFALISPWIDPVTSEKIKVLRGDYIQTLAEYIDEDQIPEEIGGTLKNVPWHWPYAEDSGVSPDQLQRHMELKTAKSA